MRASFTLVGVDGVRHQATAEWAGPATLAQLVGAAGMVLPHTDASLWVDGHLFGPATPIDLAGLHDGTIVSLLATLESGGPADPARSLHLAVTAGPGAGTTVPLAIGATVVGRRPECALTLADPAVSGRHLAVHVERSGRVTVEDLHSSYGTSLDGVALTAPTALTPGQVLRVGDTLLEVRPGTPADAVLHPSGVAFEVRRPPRLLAAPLDAEVAWPPEPAPPGRQSLPLAASLVPLVLGLVLYFATKQILTLLLIGITPLLAVINVVSSTRTGKIAYRRAVAEYRQALALADEALAEAVRHECALRRAAAPDAATVLALTSGPRRRLWERRRWDDDFLHVRLGLANLPSTVRRVVRNDYTVEHLDPVDAPLVPAVVPLAETGVLGVAGSPATIGFVASWLVAQVASESGPADLQIVVLAGESPHAEERWGWARWLPHAASVDPGGPAAFGTTRETIEARVSELVELIEERRAAQEANRGRLRSIDWPRALLVLDPAYDLRRVVGVDVILRHGPEVGIFALCVESAESYLPVECRAVLAVGDRSAGVLHRSGQPDLAVAALDLVAAEWCDRLGRDLAPLRDPEAVTAGGAIPSSVRLVDLIGLDRLDAAAVVDAWRAERRSTTAVVGVGLDGPVRLDLRVDGPHGLVAGTTGAGKSEFLQTLVASLAVANRHDALNFLLVDYKGGSAFRDCARLPHTVGVVTDLDGHLTERALVSLSAELKRREEMLAAGGAKDIDDYVAMGEPVGALPRLLIVIDEFAGLVAELPDFVSGLVGIAQRGRSLGIHLILATQRPSGVVSPEIRANTNLRVALRVTSPSESADIIDAPDAARITPATPGRAYAMTGHSALTAFQSARVGGPATAVATAPGPEVAVAAAGWDRAGRAPALTKRTTTGEVDPADTDLARLAAVLIEAAGRTGVPRQPQPWLAPLPEVLSLDAFGPAALSAQGEVAPVPYGSVDLPADQRQEAATYDLAAGRHLLVGGTPGSGRTTFLRTLAAALVARTQPTDLWLYAIDCGGGELRRLAALPHCGAVVTRTEPDRADRLLTRLHAEMARRSQALAAAGFADVAEQRAAVAADERLPYIVVMIDRWEGFMSTFDAIDTGRLTDLVLDMAREGGGAGIRLVVTGDRTVLVGKLAAMVEERLCLSLADRSDYAMAGIDSRRVPDRMGPGRAVRSADSAELQVAVPGDGPSGAAQSAALMALAAGWGERPAAAPRPFRVDTLPNEVDAGTMRPYLAGRPSAPHWALVGLGGDELAAVGLDVCRSGGFVVAGPRRSGRSSTLVVMAESLAAGGCEVMAFCPRVSPLRGLRGRPGVVEVYDGDDPTVSAVLEALNAVTGPLAVIVDDAMLLNTAPVAELLDHVAREGPDQGHALLVAGTADELMRPMRGYVYEVCQSRTGLLLCPESHTHGELLGVRLPRSAVFRRPVGRGILVDSGHLLTVQVPRSA